VLLFKINTCLITILFLIIIENGYSQTKFDYERCFEKKLNDFSLNLSNEKLLIIGEYHFYEENSKVYEEFLNKKIISNKKITKILYEFGFAEEILANYYLETEDSTIGKQLDFTDSDFKKILDNVVEYNKGIGVGQQIRFVGIDTETSFSNYAYALSILLDDKIKSDTTSFSFYFSKMNFSVKHNKNNISKKNFKVSYYDFVDELFKAFRDNNEDVKLELGDSYEKVAKLYQSYLLGQKLKFTNFNKSLRRKKRNILAEGREDFMFINVKKILNNLDSNEVCIQIVGSAHLENYKNKKDGFQSLTFKIKESGHIVKTFMILYNEPIVYRDVVRRKILKKDFVDVAQQKMKQSKEFIIVDKNCADFNTDNEFDYIILGCGN